METIIIKCTQCNIVINELLCFIQNKIDVMDEESIISLSASSFTISEISVAKELLFKSLSPVPRDVSKRRKKVQKDLENIICAFKNTEPDQTPIFVARELRKLPAITFDHVDVSTLLKDIVTLRHEVKHIKEAYATVEQLNCIKSEVDCMKYASLIDNEQFGNININKRRGGYLLENGCDSGPIGILDLPSTHQPNSTRLEQENMEGKNDQRSLSLVQQQNTSRVPVSTERLDRFTLETVEQISADATHTEVNEVDETLNEKNKSFAEIVQYENKSKDKINKGKWTLVENKKKQQNRTESVRGKAIVNHDDRFKQADLKISLFVSNVHKDTPEKDIMEYIQSKTKEKVILQKIRTKTEKGYNSYKVTVPKNKSSLFISEELWPDGVTCRHFMPYRNYGVQGDQSRINSV